MNVIFKTEELLEWKFKQPLASAVYNRQSTYLPCLNLSTYILFGKRVNELRKNLVRDDCLGELIRVVGKTSESEGG